MSVDLSNLSDELVLKLFVTHLDVSEKDICSFLDKKNKGELHRRVCSSLELVVKRFGDNPQVLVSVLLAAWRNGDDKCDSKHYDFYQQVFERMLQTQRVTVKMLQKIWVCNPKKVIAGTGRLADRVFRREVLWPAYKTIAEPGHLEWVMSHPDTCRSIALDCLRQLVSRGAAPDDLLLACMDKYGRLEIGTDNNHPINISTDLLWSEIIQRQKPKPQDTDDSKKKK